MREAPCAVGPLLLPGSPVKVASGGSDAAPRINTREAAAIELVGLAGMIERRLADTPELIPVRTAAALTTELVRDFGATLIDRGDGDLTLSLCGINSASYEGTELALLRNWEAAAKRVASALIA